MSSAWTVLVTGACGRLGAEVVTQLSRSGAVVVAVDLPGMSSVQPVTWRALEGSPERGAVFRLSCDVSSEPEVLELATRLDHWGEGGLDAILHTAYAQREAPIVELTLADWNTVLAGCLTSSFLVCKYLLPLIARRGGGVLVTTSSVLAHVPKRGNAAYAAAKAGLAQLTRIAALEHASERVRCVVLEPGDFKTADEIAMMSDTNKVLIRERTLTGRSATPDEIAKVAMFLLSESSSYINGTVVTVDGGFSAVK